MVHSIAPIPWLLLKRGTETRDGIGQDSGPKTINDQVQLLTRLCGEQGVLIRATLRRDKALKLPLPPSPGRPYSAEEKARMLEEAQKLRTPQMRAALALDLNTGLRDVAGFVTVRAGSSLADRNDIPL